MDTYRIFTLHHVTSCHHGTYHNCRLYINRNSCLGDLSDEEVAVEAARQFFEALIAEDYDAAG
jgi:hypothetical protein